MMEAKISVASHKILSIPLKSGYSYVYVGKAAHQNFLTENSFSDHDYHNNISEKNHSYCELTVFHRIFHQAKNNPNSIYGLVHYRRRFLNNNGLVNTLISKAPGFLQSKKLITNLLLHRELTEATIRELLSDRYDVLIPDSVIMPSSIHQNYKDKHLINDLYVIGEIISEKYKDYKRSYDLVLNGRELIPFNMMVAKGDFILNYGSWLFEILSQAEGRIDLSGRNSYQRRVFGFLAERLMTIYFLKNKFYRVKKMPVAFLGL